MSLAERWERDEKQGIMKKIIGNFRKEAPLKERLAYALKEIKVINSKLSTALDRVKQRDKNIFSQVIHAIQENDAEHAAIYANELSELRKLGKFVSQAQLALELISLRIETVLTLGEITAGSLAPALGVLRSIQAHVIEVIPEAKKEVEELFGTLNSTLIELNANTDIAVNLEVADDEARKILEEAEIVAESKIRENFPEVPLDLIQSNEQEELSS